MWSMTDTRLGELSSGNGRTRVWRDDLALVDARLAARTKPLRTERGVLTDQGRWAAAASHRALGAIARVGHAIQLQMIEAPLIRVTVLVERVAVQRSTVITGEVIEASNEAIKLEYDLGRTFPSYFWEPQTPRAHADS